MKQHRVSLHDRVGPEQHEPRDQPGRGDDPAEEELAQAVDHQGLDAFVRVGEEVGQGGDGRFQAVGAGPVLGDLLALRVKFEKVPFMVLSYILYQSTALENPCQKISGESRYEPRVSG